MNADKTLLTPLCKRLGTTLSRRGMLFVGLGIVIIIVELAIAYMAAKIGFKDTNHEYDPRRQVGTAE